MVRVLARHAVVTGIDDPLKFCNWAREVALAEGAEGWAAPADDGVEVWFEGTAQVVDIMLDWCASVTESTLDGLAVTAQRPALKGGFDVLEAAPAS